MRRVARMERRIKLGVLAFILTSSLDYSFCQVGLAAELYVLQYGKLKQYQYVFGAQTVAVDEFPLQIVVLKREDQHVLFGTGVSDIQRLQKNVQIDDFQPPAQLLSRVGVSADKVGVLVLSSIGYMSAGDIGRYSNARIFVHEGDVAGGSRQDILPETWERLVSGVREGKVVLLRERRVRPVPDLELVPILEGLMGRLLGITQVAGRSVLLGGEVLHSSEFYNRIMPKAFGVSYEAVQRIVETNRVRGRDIIPLADQDVKRFREIARGIFKVD